MLERARAAGVPAAGVTADSVCGDDRRLRGWLEAREQPYVLAVSGKAYVNAAATWTQRRVRTLLAEVAPQPAAAWQRPAAGAGSKGPRPDGRARRPLVPPLREGYERWFLVRRGRGDPAGLQGYVALAPAGTTLERLVRVAGSRGTIAVASEAARGEVGLDQYEVRGSHGWSRHIPLALLAQALLAQALLAQALLTVIRTRSSAAPAARVPRRGRHTGRPQQAVIFGQPGRRTRRGRSTGPAGSMAAFRRQRQAQERHQKRQSAGRETSPSATSPS